METGAKSKALANLTSVSPQLPILYASAIQKMAILKISFLIVIDLARLQLMLLSTIIILYSTSVLSCFTFSQEILYIHFHSSSSLLNSSSFLNSVIIIHIRVSSLLYFLQFSFLVTAKATQCNGLPTSVSTSGLCHFNSSCTFH